MKFAEADFVLHENQNKIIDWLIFVQSHKDSDGSDDGSDDGDEKKKVNRICLFRSSVLHSISFKTAAYMVVYRTEVMLFWYAITF